MSTADRLLGGLIAVLLLAGIPTALNQMDARADRQAIAARASTLGALGDTALADGDAVAAARAFAQASALQPGVRQWRASGAEAWTQWLSARRELPEGVDAVEVDLLLSEALSRSGEDAKRLLALGRVRRVRGMDAGPLFAQAHALDDSLASVLWERAEALVASGKPDEAQPLLVEALKTDNELHGARLALGRLLLEKGENELASSLLEQASEALVDDGSAHYDFGRSLVALKRWQHVDGVMQKALESDPTLHGAYRYMGEALAHVKRFGASARAFQLSWDKAGDLEALRMLGRLYARLGDHQKAAGAFAEVRDAIPEDPEALCQLGASLAVVGQHATAVGVLKQCIEVTEGSRDHEKRYKKAFELLEAARAALEKQQKRGG